MDVHQTTRTLPNDRMPVVQRPAAGWLVATAAAGVSASGVGKWRDRHAAEGALAWSTGLPARIEAQHAWILPIGTKQRAPTKAAFANGPMPTHSTAQPNARTQCFMVARLSTSPDSAQPSADRHDQARQDLLGSDIQRPLALGPARTATNFGSMAPIGQDPPQGPGS